IFVARCASRYWNVGHVNTWSSGSIATCWSSFTLPSSSVVATNISPNVLGSTNRRSPPCWNVTTTCVCGGSAIRPFARVNLPLIPKCTTQTSPPSSESKTYLPRRSVFMILWPDKRDANSFRVLWRRITRIAFFDPLTSTSLIFFPTTSRSRSRRITSTSGSSMHAPSHRSSGASLRDARVRLSRGLLLRFLLRAPDARPQRLAGDHDGRRELLLMVGTPVLDLVHRQRAELLRRELLEDRLVVAVPFAPYVRLHPGLEQALDQLASGIETQVDVDGTENGFQRVGEDARLVAAAGLLLALAQQDDRPQVEVACHVRERRHVHDRRAELREITLGHARVHPVRQIGHDQAEHRITQELEPFVRDRQIVLERERSVGEGSLTQFGVVEGNAERAIECFEPVVDGRLAHAATRPRPLGGRRSTRSSRRRDAEASAVCIAGMRCTSALRPSRSHGASRSASCSASSSGRPSCGFLPCLGSRGWADRGTDRRAPRTADRARRGRDTPPGCGSRHTSRRAPGSPSDRAGRTASRPRPHRGSSGRVRAVRPDPVGRCRLPRRDGSRRAHGGPARTAGRTRRGTGHIAGSIDLGPGPKRGCPR